MTATKTKGKSKTKGTATMTREEWLNAIATAVRPRIEAVTTPGSLR